MGKYSISMFAATLVIQLLSASHAVAQTPQDELLMQWQRGINETRADRLVTLAPQMMPECVVLPTSEDMGQFYVFWRTVAQEEIDQRKAMGWPLEDPNEERTRESLKQIGITSLRQYSLSELTHAGPQMPNADNAVRAEIMVWRALHCVVERYGAEKFFTANGNTKMGMEWPWDPILSSFGYDLLPVNSKKTRAYRLPNMLGLEPLDALGRFFRATQQRGLLKFKDKREERYFFERYESDYFYDMRNVAKARAWFHTPPWRPDAPHLERPTRPEKRAFDAPVRR